MTPDQKNANDQLKQFGEGLINLGQGCTALGMRYHDDRGRDRVSGSTCWKLLTHEHQKSLFYKVLSVDEIAFLGVRHQTGTGPAGDS